MADNDFRLPPYTVEAVMGSKAQTMDWSLELLGIPKLWTLTKGKGIRVAVLDTGIDAAHPDLQGAILGAEDFSNSEYGIKDLAGHATHVSGTIAARDNETGVVGIAPECGLLIGKVLGDNGAGTNTAIAAGIRWAIENKADIISLSLGSPYPDATIEAAIKESLSRGVFVVAAAGNEGNQFTDTVGYPARYEGVISVGSIDRRKQVSRFSSRGQRLDVVAPGDRILSLWPGGGLSVLSGTSMATPAVSAIVALLLSIIRPATVKDLIDRLHATSIDLGPEGWDRDTGYGLIDPSRLIGSFPPSPLPAPDDATVLTLKRSHLTAAGMLELKRQIAGVA